MRKLQDERILFSDCFSQHFVLSCKSEKVKNLISAISLEESETA
jgi:hypothetical protein